MASTVLAAAIASLGALSCYRPNIMNGGFFCAEAGKLCPDGFVCDRSTNTCLLPGSVADAQVSDVRDAPVATDGHTDAAEVACFMPVAGCTPQVASGCDPFCQTDCGCQQKCSVNTAGTVACNAPLPGGRGAYDSCDISAAGAVNQTDNCAPGLVCVVDHCGSHCYAFCRSDGDCPGSTCTGDAGGGVKVCAVKFATCNPVGAAAQSSCATSGATAQGCYVSATVPDNTICDCPTNALPVSGSCTTNLDCVAGLVCVDALGTGDLRCQQLCTVGSTGTCGSCSTGRSKPLGGSTLYGYCY